MLFVVEGIKHNWKSGLTVALVSLPLSISLGVAAGATPLMGIITAIWAGLIASLFGGSNYNIVGPTGALSGVLASFALVHGVTALPMLAVMSGLFILFIYLLRWERYIALIPSSALHGFTLGVAFIIGLNQLNFALGLTVPAAHEGFILNVLESLRHIPDTDVLTFGVFAAGLLFLLLWAKRSFLIPGPIILAAFGILYGYAAHMFYPFSALQTLKTKFGTMTGALWQPSSFSFEMVSQTSIMAAGTIAIIAILETLISAKIADGMTRTRHRPRPEVLALGLANIASGIFGGIPATAALARTALNVKTGATHRMSAAINSVVVAIIGLALFPGFQYLPLSIVAAILVYVAVRMVSREHFAHLYKYDKIAFFTSLLVAVITVLEDPIIGILVGAVVSLLVFINKIAEAGGEVTINRGQAIVGRYNSRELAIVSDHGEILVYRIAGQLTYINAQAHLAAISHIKSSTDAVVLSFRNLYYIDIDGLDAVEEIIQVLQAQNHIVSLTGMSPLISSLFAQTTWFGEFTRAERVFESSSAAVKYLQGILGRSSPAL